jgi:phosphoglycolate phosphatase-like HAD superfamily hydrolase/CMP-N-acetylneuraminic acid synthetase
MVNRVVALVPLKLDSRRLPHKNFLRLGKHPLAYYIFDTLSRIDEIDKVFCYTSQSQILASLPNNVELLKRPHYLDGNSIKANELFHDAVSRIDAEIIIICHATGPFIKESSIIKGLHAVHSKKFDCAFAVQRNQNYCWYQGETLNYDPQNMVQTQDLVPVFSETSGLYVFRKSDYLKNGTRIGKKPFLVEVDVKEGIDIDYPSDFSLAELFVDYEPILKTLHNGVNLPEIARNIFQFKNIQHVAFDLDGVLIDSLAVMEIAWSKAMSEVSYDIPFSEYKKYIGIPFRDIIMRLGCDINQFDRISDIYNYFSRKNINKITAYDGVIESLICIKKEGIKISIVTSKNKERTLEIITRILPNIQFDTVITPEDISSDRGKPCPDSLLLACIKTNVDPRNTIYIGDMEVDRETAYRSGVHFFFAGWGYSENGC